MATQRRNEWQQGIILSTHTDSNGNFKYILISKKTGFRDVTIGGKRYYYNANKTFSKAKDISFEKIIKDNSKYEPLKQKIIVRRTKADYATI